MNQIIDLTVPVYKPISVTPFQMVQKFKEEFPQYSNTKIGYAGRLDPLAHGVLLLMVGEACKRRDQYQLLPKTYIFKVMFGVNSDTYDPLGILTLNNSITIDRTELENNLDSFRGKFEQEYPPFSSFHIDGVPMYKLSKEGKLNIDQLPTKSVEITEIELLEIKSLPIEDLSRSAIERIKRVEGHFRQDEAVNCWEKLLTNRSGEQFTIATISVSASSGTYVRSISHKLGLNFNTGAIAFEIFRSEVGSYMITDCEFPYGDYGKLELDENYKYTG